MPKYIAVGERIFIERDSNKKERTESGLIIPETHDPGKSSRATIVAVGRGRFLECGQLVKPCVEPGNRVIVSKYAGEEVELDGKKYEAIREDDIIAILPEENHVSNERNEKDASHQEDATHQRAGQEAQAEDPAEGAGAGEARAERPAGSPGGRRGPRGKAQGRQG